MSWAMSPQFQPDLIAFLRTRISLIADHNIDVMNFSVQGRPNLALEQLEAAEYEFDEIRRCRRH
jgi:hypothetical protein